MKKILYIGGFEMPDRNAAASRVLSIAKALTSSGYKVEFYGITKHSDYAGQVDGYFYEAKGYPLNYKQWIEHVLGSCLIEYIKTHNPDLVITYNYPAIAQYRLIRYCHSHNIKVIGDITEWYHSNDFIRWLDTCMRMYWCNKRLDGIIAISSFLFKYYCKQNCIQIPPLVDKTEKKWTESIVEDGSTKRCIRLIYVGSPGRKDRLDYVISNIEKIGTNNLVLDVVGINAEEYSAMYRTICNNNKKYVNFHGRLEHIDAIRLLRRSDFQIFFRDSTRSNNAGFPTKLVESFSAGIPVITNRISNISDYITDGYNGFLIDSLTDIDVRNVLIKVSSLSLEYVNEMKRCVDSQVFDYHNYIDGLVSFVHSSVIRE